MALFEITPNENSDKSLWINSVKSQLTSHTLTKSSYYGFDFLKDAPLKDSTKFEWVSDSQDILSEYRYQSTRYSSTKIQEDFADNPPEELDQIPSIDYQNVNL